MLVAGCRDPEQLRIARELQLRSALLVPLVVRGRVTRRAHLGLHRRRSGSTTTTTSRFAEHLARRAATAIDNAELHSQTRAAAEQLQRAVLPEALAGADRLGGRLPLPALRPRRGRRRLLRRLPAGRRPATSLFIGDVMGRGVAAAAAMAEMRAADPRVRLGRPRPGRGARQARRDGRVLRQRPAGHPGLRAGRRRGRPTWCGQRRPPAARRCCAPTGRVEQLPYADGPPLGRRGRTDRERLTVPFEVGDTLLAFTDGLVERRDEDIDTGLDRLGHVVPTWRSAVARRAWSASSTRCATTPTTTTWPPWACGGRAGGRLGRRAAMPPKTRDVIRHRAGGAAPRRRAGVPRPPAHDGSSIGWSTLSPGTVPQKSSTQLGDLRVGRGARRRRSAAPICPQVLAAGRGRGGRRRRPGPRPSSTLTCARPGEQDQLTAEQHGRHAELGSSRWQVTPVPSERQSIGADRDAGPCSRPPRGVPGGRCRRRPDLEARGRSRSPG